MLISSYSAPYFLRPFSLVWVSSFLDKPCLFLQKHTVWDCNTLCNLGDYIADIQDVFLTYICFPLSIFFRPIMVTFSHMELIA